MSGETLEALRAENAALRETIEDLEDTVLGLQTRIEQLERGGDDGARIPLEVVNLRLDNGWTTMRAWRRYRGLTLDDIAAATGFAKGYLSDVETRKKPLTRKLRAALAKALDAHPATLWTEDEDAAIAAE